MKVPNDRWRVLLVSAGLVLATLGVYWAVHDYEFINLDDDLYVSDNPHIRNGYSWESVRWAFSAGLLHKSGNVDYWQPVTVLSRLLDVQLFGLNPGGHHLMNLLFHVGNTVLLFWVLRRMTGATANCAFVAALFALHPLQVESVAWVTERKDVLFGLFWMLTMWAYLRYTEKPGTRRYLMVLLVFALGLMAKPMVVTLPCVLLLLDFWPLGRTRWERGVGGADRSTSPKRLVAEKLPLLGLAVVSTLVTFGALRQHNVVIPIEHLPVGLRIQNAICWYARCMGKTIWPADLAVYYPYTGPWPVSQVAAVVFVTGIVTVAIIRAARRYPYLVVGWFWCLIALLPVIVLTQVGAQSMADRYTYIPLIGLLIVVAWGVPDLTSKWRYRREVLACAGAAVIAACVVATRMQVAYWRDSATLFEHALQVTSNNSVAHRNLGVALAQQGRFEEAIVHYRETLRIMPHLAGTHNNLGNALQMMGQLEEAVRHYETALRLDPKFPAAHNNLGNALLKMGRTEEAIAHLQRAVMLEPNYTDARIKLGVALGEQGKLPEAIAQFEEALRLGPRTANVYYNLGAALARQGKLVEAAEQFQHAVAADPQFELARHALEDLRARGVR
jgi:Tfp pilus assembly protein PilF